MRDRKGEKLGWTGGWLGGFLWLLLLSIVWLVKGDVTSGIVGLVLFAAAVLCIIVFAPWKHPETKYWKLMLPVYVVFAAAISICIWFSGGMEAVGLRWSMLLCMLPVLLPFATAGARCWKDGGKAASGSDEAKA